MDVYDAEGGSYHPQQQQLIYDAGPPDYNTVVRMDLTKRERLQAWFNGKVDSMKGSMASSLSALDHSNYSLGRRCSISPRHSEAGLSGLNEHGGGMVIDLGDDTSSRRMTAATTSASNTSNQDDDDDDKQNPPSYEMAILQIAQLNQAQSSGSQASCSTATNTDQG